MKEETLSSDEISSVGSELFNEFEEDGEELLHSNSSAEESLIDLYLPSTIASNTGRSCTSGLSEGSLIVGSISYESVNVRNTMKVSVSDPKKDGFGGMLHVTGSKLKRQLGCDIANHQQFRADACDNVETRKNKKKKNQKSVPYASCGLEAKKEIENSSDDDFQQTVGTFSLKVYEFECSSSVFCG